MVDHQQPSKTVVTMVDHGHHFAWERYHRQEGDMLPNLKRNIQRDFYKLFRKSKKRGTDKQLNAQYFCRYFSDLMSTDEHAQVRSGEHDHQEPDSIF